MRDLIRIASILGLAVALTAVFGCVQKKQPQMEAPPQCTAEMAAELDLALQQLTSYYAFDKSKLTRKNRKLLSKNRSTLEAQPPCPIYVLGHSDRQGVAPYNDHLSQQRVASVLSFLESLGIDTERLKARPYGEGHPATDGTTSTDRASNRRVELRAQDPYDL